MKIKVLASLCVLIACAAPFLAQAPAPVQPPIPCEYYPLEIGQRWTYRVTDLKSPQAKTDAKRTVVVEVERTENYTLKTIAKDKTETSKEYVGYILKSTSGDKIARDHVVVLPDGVYKIHVAGTQMDPPLLFFKFPVKTGETWASNSVSGNTTVKGTSTATFVKGTEANTDFWVVSFNNNEPDDKRAKITYWFGRGYGMVKQEIKTKNHELELTLEKFEPAKKAK